MGPVLYSSYELRTQTLKKIFLCSGIEINGQSSDDQSFESGVEMIDDYENFITTGPCFIDGRFMEKVVLAKGFLHKLFKKKTFFLRNLYYTPLFHSKDIKRHFSFQWKSVLKY